MSTSPPPSSDHTATPLLLFDGHCPLCFGTVRLVLRADRQGLLRFASLESSIGTAVRARHPELARIDSLVLVESYDRPDERVVIKSTAVLRVWRMLGWPWKVLLVGYLIPREIRDSLYDVVAWWRLRLFGRYASCPVPPPEVRDRFLAL